MRCTALRLEWRNARFDVREVSSRMRVVRRFTEARTRSASMIEKASVPAARKISNANIVLSLSPKMVIRNSNMASNLEVHQPVHDEVADPHPAAGHGKADLGQAFVPDAGVEFR